MSILNKAIKKVESDQQKNSPLFACVLGVQGSGKSSCVATFDLPTLIIRTALEYHGTQNVMALAKKRLGKKVEIAEVVLNDEGETAQQAWFKFHAVLDELISADELPYKVIVLDSITDLQLSVVKETEEWKELCKGGGTKYNKFNEPDAYITMLKSIMEKLTVLNQRRGVHVVLVMAAQMQTVGDDGTMAIARPAIDGLKVSSFINKACGTVVFVNKVVTEDGVEHSFCFDSSLKRESKDAMGRVSKTENFNIRVQGLTTDQLPDNMPADFKKLIAMRG